MPKYPKKYYNLRKSTINNVWRITKIASILLMKKAFMFVDEEAWELGLLKIAYLDKNVPKCVLVNKKFEIIKIINLQNFGVFDVFLLGKYIYHSRNKKSINIEILSEKLGENKNGFNKRYYK